MALGVDGMRARRVVTKTVLLTLGTLGFVVSLTLVYQSMRAVMDVGGSCASGGPYAISRPCPEGVAWVMPVGIFGMIISVGVSLLGSFSEGGPRPYAFAWSALFLALGWNFLEYGFDPPGGGTSAGWLVCGFVFVVMGGVPLVGLLWKTAARWALWGPVDERPRPREPRRAYAPAGAAGGLVVPRPAAPAPPPMAAPPPMTEPPAAEPPSPAERDVVDRLERLADLHERGLLDDHEYERVKDKILREEIES
jgi:hypothetical protein